MYYNNKDNIIAGSSLYDLPKVTDCKCPILFEDRDRYIQTLMDVNKRLHSQPCCGSSDPECCCSRRKA